MHRANPVVVCFPRYRRTVFIFWMAFLSAVWSVPFGRSACAKDPVKETEATLTKRLGELTAGQWIELAGREGDLQRGLTLFHDLQLACAQCHALHPSQPVRTGPILSQVLTKHTDQRLVDALLEPSKEILEGFEQSVILTDEGKVIAGRILKQTETHLEFLEGAGDVPPRQFELDRIERIERRSDSLMPAGLVQKLGNQQRWLDLLRLLIELRSGGESVAMRLAADGPKSSQIAPYESQVDHAGMLRDLDHAAFERGEAIYRRVCFQCHGDFHQMGSLPTSLRFGQGDFKNGSSPYAMYQTLTRGFGQMAPQAWMVPQQKYDVIHYIRETFLKDHRPAQYLPIDEEYLAQLPRGTTRGPAPSTLEPWNAMDYGNLITHTFEVPGQALNIAYKGMAIRLDPGPGGAARGNHWMLFCTDTLRMAAGWSHRDGAERMTNWRSIQFNGEHQIHPAISGQVHWSLPNGPGWANPAAADGVDPWDDGARVEGRDGRRYGPLPKSWGQWLGHSTHEGKTILHYRIGDATIDELPQLEWIEDRPVFIRRVRVGPHSEPLRWKILPPSQAPGPTIDRLDSTGATVRWGHRSDAKQPAQRKPQAKLDGGGYWEIPQTQWLATATPKQWTLVAQIQTSTDGTIAAFAPTSLEWAPNGMTWFIRDGRLVFDIGWVGAVASADRVDDGKPHRIALAYDESIGKVRMAIDGQQAAEGILRRNQTLNPSVFRVGYTSSNFPQPKSLFEGRIEHLLLLEGVEDIQRWTESSTLLDGKTLARFPEGDGWQWRDGKTPSTTHIPSLDATFFSRNQAIRWEEQAGALVLAIDPTEEEAEIAVALAPLDSQSMETREEAKTILDGLDRERLGAPLPWNRWLAGGAAAFPETIESALQVQEGVSGPLAVDSIALPSANPWLALVRPSGIDFVSDGSLIVATWDGDIWRVALAEDAKKARWRRIASGLFQPLGVKVIEDRIHAICRDQLVRLEDRNGDGSIDHYATVNHDHQVTEHFHEFAMGLQVDAQGNFYYAKSGRHALKAVVPHHGTLLRVSPDGEKTDILATGFRAANGVCLNPDGTFFVTDQEGFWNPKNRINWLRRPDLSAPLFYGNLWGYTDITDPSDDSMEPPLCWITNAKDRSPAELLWVNSPTWGPLDGKLLSLSYGYGKIFLVPHEQVGGAMQGGVIELPIEPVGSGLMRARFHPKDGHLYGCGMFAWAGNATEPGGLYRFRPTGKPWRLPVGLQMRPGAITMQFTEPLDGLAASEGKFSVRVWDLKRSERYGSDHLNERELKIQRVEVLPDPGAIRLEVPELRPTWGLEVRYQMPMADGQVASGELHGTMHPESPE
jgi:putative heme-binding domain-containing protein